MRDICVTFLIKCYLIVGLFYVSKLRFLRVSFTLNHSNMYYFCLFATRKSGFEIVVYSLSNLSTLKKVYVRSWEGGYTEVVISWLGQSCFCAANTSVIRWIVRLQSSKLCVFIRPWSLTPLRNCDTLQEKPPSFHW